MKYYHGTSIENFVKITKSGDLSTHYYGEKGIYITDNYLHANNFGEVVFIFDDLDIDKFQTDDVNDGIFYKGGIEIKDFHIIIRFDQRVFRGDDTLLFGFLHKQGTYLELKIKENQMVYYKKHKNAKFTNK